MARYAVYYTPPQESDLADFGRGWLGYDVETGSLCTRPIELDGLAKGITVDPQRYGFHATLKAPFHLARGVTEADILTSFQSFCAGQDAAPVGPLRIAALGAFLALVPASDTGPGLTKLAASAVHSFDGFRAPLTEAERTRRRPERLTSRQRGYLEDWGYPFVFEDFRFHMTLTSPLDLTHRERVSQALRPLIVEIIKVPLVIEAISLVRQSDPDSSFVVIRRVPLAAASASASGCR